jgi:hypothetical protein
VAQVTEISLGVADVSFGSFSTELGCSPDVRFTRYSDRTPDAAGGPARADSVAKVVLPKVSNILRAVGAVLV